ncbi:MAG TPA: hypothetical protein DDW49_09985 [Deltaproteobacteria bacterium]|nr:hypothetical protein [Deltaproteobacteria bacterium]
MSRKGSVGQALAAIHMDGVEASIQAMQIALIVIGLMLLTGGSAAPEVPELLAAEEAAAMTGRLTFRQTLMRGVRTIKQSPKFKHALEGAKGNARIMVVNDLLERAFGFKADGGFKLGESLAGWMATAIAGFVVQGSLGQAVEGLAPVNKFAREAMANTGRVPSVARQLWEAGKFRYLNLPGISLHLGADFVQEATEEVFEEKVGQWLQGKSGLVLDNELWNIVSGTAAGGQVHKGIQKLQIGLTLGKNRKAMEQALHEAQEEQSNAVQEALEKWMEEQKARQRDKTENEESGSDHESVNHLVDTLGDENTGYVVPASREDVLLTLAMAAQQGIIRAVTQDGEVVGYIVPRDETDDENSERVVLLEKPGEPVSIPDADELMSVSGNQSGESPAEVQPTLTAPGPLSTPGPEDSLQPPMQAAPGGDQGMPGSPVSSRKPWYTGNHRPSEAPQRKLYDNLHTQVVRLFSNHPEAPYLAVSFDPQTNQLLLPHEAQALGRPVINLVFYRDNGFIHANTAPMDSHPQWNSSSPEDLSLKTLNGFVTDVNGKLISNPAPTYNPQPQKDVEAFVGDIIEEINRAATGAAFVPDAEALNPKLHLYANRLLCHGIEPAEALELFKTVLSPFPPTAEELVQRLEFATHVAILQKNRLTRIFGTEVSLPAPTFTALRPWFAEWQANPNIVLLAIQPPAVLDYVRSVHSAPNIAEAVRQINRQLRQAFYALVDVEPSKQDSVWRQKAESLLNWDVSSGPEGMDLSTAQKRLQAAARWRDEAVRATQPKIVSGSRVIAGNQVGRSLIELTTGQAEVLSRLGEHHQKTRNGDSAALTENENVVVGLVGDGVGSSRLDDVASGKTVKFIVDDVESRREGLPESVTAVGTDFDNEMKPFVGQAHPADDRPPPATTIAGFEVDKKTNRVRSVHAGDSLVVFLKRTVGKNGKVSFKPKLLTKPHGKDGALTSMLGGGATQLEVDVSDWENIDEGDIVLAFTDGLREAYREGHVSLQALQNLAEHYDDQLDSLVDALEAMSLQKMRADPKGGDNLSVVAYRHKVKKTTQKSVPGKPVPGTRTTLRITDPSAALDLSADATDVMLTSEAVAALEQMTEAQRDEFFNKLVKAFNPSQKPKGAVPRRLFIHFEGLEGNEAKLKNYRDRLRQILNEADAAHHYTAAMSVPRGAIGLVPAVAGGGDAEVVKLPIAEIVARFQTADKPQALQAAVDFYQAQRQLGAWVVASLEHVQAMLDEGKSFEEVNAALREIFGKYQEQQKQLDDFYKKNGLDEWKSQVTISLGVSFRQLAAYTQSNLNYLVENPDLDDLRANLPDILDEARSPLGLQPASQAVESMALPHTGLNNQLASEFTAWLCFSLGRPTQEGDRFIFSGKKGETHGEKGFSQFKPPEITDVEIIRMYAQVLGWGFSFKQNGDRVTITLAPHPLAQEARKVVPITRVSKPAPQVDYHNSNEIRWNEIEMFPEFAGGVSLDAGRYIHYSPSYFFQHNLVTPELVNQLRDNPARRVLSVGAGKGYLERFLVNVCRVGQNQIVLTDVDAQGLPAGFENHAFDMWGNWPEMSGTFDTILFPQSIFFRAKPELRTQEVITQYRASELYGLIQKAKAHLNEGGQLRMLVTDISADILPALTALFAAHGQIADISLTNDELLVIKNIRDQSDDSPGKPVTPGAVPGTSASSGNKNDSVGQARAREIFGDKFGALENRVNAWAVDVQERFWAEVATMQPRVSRIQAEPGSAEEKSHLKLPIQQLAQHIDQTLKGRDLPVDPNQPFVRINGTPKEAHEFHHNFKPVPGRDKPVDFKFNGVIYRMPLWVMDKMDAWILAHSHGVTTETVGSFVTKKTVDGTVEIVDFIPKPSVSGSVKLYEGQLDGEEQMITRALSDSEARVLGYPVGSEYELPQGNIPVHSHFENSRYQNSPSPTDFTQKGVLKAVRTPEGGLIFYKPGEGNLSQIVVAGKLGEPVSPSSVPTPPVNPSPQDPSSGSSQGPGPAGLAVLLGALGLAPHARADTPQDAVSEAGAMATVAQPEPIGQNTDGGGGLLMAILAAVLAVRKFFGRKPVQTKDPELTVSPTPPQDPLRVGGSPETDATLHLPDGTTLSMRALDYVDPLEGLPMPANQREVDYTVRLLNQLSQEVQEAKTPAARKAVLAKLKTAEGSLKAWVSRRLLMATTLGSPQKYLAVVAEDYANLLQALGTLYASLQIQQQEMFEALKAHGRTLNYLASLPDTNQTRTEAHRWLDARRTGLPGKTVFTAQQIAEFRRKTDPLVGPERVDTIRDWLALLPSIVDPKLQEESILAGAQALEATAIRVPFQISNEIFGELLTDFYRLRHLLPESAQENLLTLLGHALAESRTVDLKNLKTLLDQTTPEDRQRILLGMVEIYTKPFESDGDTSFPYSKYLFALCEAYPEVVDSISSEAVWLGLLNAMIYEIPLATAEKYLERVATPLEKSKLLLSALLEEYNRLHINGSKAQRKQNDGRIVACIDEIARLSPDRRSFEVESLLLLKAALINEDDFRASQAIEDDLMLTTAHPGIIQQAARYNRHTPSFYSRYAALAESRLESEADPEVRARIFMNLFRLMGEQKNQEARMADLLFRFLGEAAATISPERLQEIQAFFDGCVHGMLEGSLFNQFEFLGHLKGRISLLTRDQQEELKKYLEVVTSQMKPNDSRYQTVQAVLAEIHSALGGDHHLPRLASPLPTQHDERTRNWEIGLIFRSRLAQLKTLILNPTKRAHQRYLKDNPDEIELEQMAEAEAEKKLATLKERSGPDVAALQQENVQVNQEIERTQNRLLREPTNSSFAWELMVLIAYRVKLMAAQASPVPGTPATAGNIDGTSPQTANNPGPVVVGGLAVLLGALGVVLPDEAGAIPNTSVLGGSATPQAVTQQTGAMAVHPTPEAPPVLQAGGPLMGLLAWWLAVRSLGRKVFSGPEMNAGLSRPMLVEIARDFGLEVREDQILKVLEDRGFQVKQEGKRVVLYDPKNKEARAYEMNEGGTEANSLAVFYSEDFGVLYEEELGTCPAKEIHREKRGSILEVKGKKGVMYWKRANNGWLAPISVEGPKLGPKMISGLEDIMDREMGKGEEHFTVTVDLKTGRVSQKAAITDSQISLVFDRDDDGDYFLSENSTKALIRAYGAEMENPHEAVVAKLRFLMMYGTSPENAMLRLVQVAEDDVKSRLNLVNALSNVLNSPIDMSQAHAPVFDSRANVNPADFSVMEDFFRYQQELDRVAKPLIDKALQRYEGGIRSLLKGLKNPADLDRELKRALPKPTESPVRDANRASNVLYGRGPGTYYDVWAKALLCFAQEMQGRPLTEGQAEVIAKLAQGLHRIFLVEGSLDLSILREYLQAVFEAQEACERAGQPFRFFIPNDPHFLLGSQPQINALLRQETRNIRGFFNMFGDQAVLLHGYAGEFRATLRDAQGNELPYFMVVSRGYHEHRNGFQVSLYPKDARIIPTNYGVNSRTPCLAKVGAIFGEDGVLRIVNIQGMKPYQSISGPSFEDRQAGLRAIADNDPLGMMLATTIAIAKEKGFQRVEGIPDSEQQAKQNSFTTKGRAQGGNQFYNLFFRRFGFVPAAGEDGYWSLDLNNLPIRRTRQPKDAVADPRRQTQDDSNTLAEYLRQVLVRAPRGRSNQWDPTRPEPVAEPVVTFWKTFYRALNDMRLRPGVHAVDESLADSQVPFLDSSPVPGTPATPAIPTQTPVSGTPATVVLPVNYTVQWNEHLDVAGLEAYFTERLGAWRPGPGNHILHVQFQGETNPQDEARVLAALRRVASRLRLSVAKTERTDAGLSALLAPRVAGGMDINPLQNDLTRVVIGQTITLDNQEYVVTKQLGRGIGGSVYLLTEKNTGRLVCLKTINGDHVQYTQESFPRLEGIPGVIGRKLVARNAYLMDYVQGWFFSTEKSLGTPTSLEPSFCHPLKRLEWAQAVLRTYQTMAEKGIYFPDVKGNVFLVTEDGEFIHLDVDMTREIRGNEHNAADKTKAMIRISLSLLLGVESMDKGKSILEVTPEYRDFAEQAMALLNAKYASLLAESNHQTPLELLAAYRNYLGELDGLARKVPDKTKLIMRVKEINEELYTLTGTYTIAISGLQGVFLDRPNLIGSFDKFDLDYRVKSILDANLTEVNKWKAIHLLTDLLMHAQAVLNLYGSEEAQTYPFWASANLLWMHQQDMKVDFEFVGKVLDDPSTSPYAKLFWLYYLTRTDEFLSDQVPEDARNLNWKLDDGAPSDQFLLLTHAQTRKKIREVFQRQREPWNTGIDQFVSPTEDLTWLNVATLEYVYFGVVPSSTPEELGIIFDLKLTTPQERMQRIKKFMHDYEILFEEGASFD